MGTRRLAGDTLVQTRFHSVGLFFPLSPISKFINKYIINKYTFCMFTYITINLSSRQLSDYPL